MNRLVKCWGLGDRANRSSVTWPVNFSPTPTEPLRVGPAQSFNERLTIRGEPPVWVLRPLASATALWSEPRPPTRKNRLNSPIAATAAPSHPSHEPRFCPSTVQPPTALGPIRTFYHQALAASQRPPTDDHWLALLVGSTLPPRLKITTQLRIAHNGGERRDP